MSASLQIAQLHLGYESPQGFHTVLQSFDLQVPAGHIASLLGPSGCGKTSVLRAIAGFEPVRAGSIHLGERLLSGPKTHLPPEQRHVGLMFQEYGLFPHLTAAQNVGFGLRSMGKAERDKRVQELLAVVGLAASGSKFPHELSGGQQQRVALARALAPSPALLMLDEPFSNLDAATRERLTVEVREILRATGQTAILVTHNAQEAETMADQICQMTPVAN